MARIQRTWRPNGGRHGTEHFVESQNGAAELKGRRMTRRLPKPGPEKLAADLKGLTLRSDRELRCAGHVRAMHEDGSKQPPPDGALKETGPNHLGLGPHSNLFSDYFLTFVFLAFAAEP
jgi:hypothetical protein